MKLRFLAGLMFVCTAQAATAAPCDPGDPNLLLPEIAALAPERMKVSQRSSVRQVVFATRIANKGSGPLQVQAHFEGTNATAKQIVNRADGTTCEVELGQFALEGGFLRLPNYGHYLVRRDDPLTGPIVATGELRSFCISDLQQIPGTDQPRQLMSSCRGPDTVEGISVGWADLYDTTDPEQVVFIDTTRGSPPAGAYFLVAIPDPHSRFLQRNPGVTANYGVATIQIPARIGDATPPEPTTIASATARPPASPTPTLPAQPTNTVPTTVATVATAIPATATRTMVVTQPAATATATLAGSSGTPTRTPRLRPTPRPRPSVRPRPTPRPRPTLSRSPRPTRVPRDATPTLPLPTATNTSAVPTSTVSLPAPTSTPTLRLPTSTAPQSVATATATATPTVDSSPQTCPGLPRTCPMPAACRTGNRLGQLYFAYPGRDRIMTTSGHVRLNSSSDGIDPASEPASFSMVDKDGQTVVRLPNLQFRESGSSWVAESSEATVTLSPALRGYNFTLRYNNANFPTGYFSVVFQMCLNIGDDGVDEQIVCQIKPNDGFLCHNNGPTF